MSTGAPSRAVILDALTIDVSAPPLRPVSRPRPADARARAITTPRPSSFNTMKDWVEELKTNVAEKNLVLAIACNKGDLAEEARSARDAGGRA